MLRRFLSWRWRQSVSRNVSTCIQKCSLSHHRSGKGKAIPLQAWTGPAVYRRLRFPDIKTICTWRWWGCQPYEPITFTPKEISLVLISVRSWVDPRAIVWLEGLGQWIITVTPYHRSGVHTFSPEIWKPPQNSKHQNGDSVDPELLINTVK
jgi:hypothetical protein